MKILFKMIQEKIFRKLTREPLFTERQLKMSYEKYLSYKYNNMNLANLLHEFSVTTLNFNIFIM